MKKKNVVILSITATVALTVVGWLVMSSQKEVHFTTTPVTENTVEVTVMATGYIQPVEEVEVGTQVSGVIEKLYVDYNSHVTKGQLLAELDKLTLNEKVNQANASLASANSELLNAQQNYDRVKLLFEQKAATQVNFEEATNRLTQSKTSVTTAKANVHQSTVNLSYASIYSPIDGVVLERTVDMGQTVAASFNTPTLFRIANDLTKMQVEANVDEADIGMIKLGQMVTFTVDAYNGETFNGEVSQIRLQPTVSNNVVTYTVIVNAPNPDEKLFPGMTANISVTVESERGITVPLEATNFQMTSEIGSKAGIPETDLKKPAGKHSVWIKTGDKLELKTIETGIDDGINIIVKSGVLPQQEVVLSAMVGTKKSIKKATPNPLMPKRPGGNR